jgi:hypothetical protein
MSFDHIVSRFCIIPGGRLYVSSYDHTPFWLPPLLLKVNMKKYSPLVVPTIPLVYGVHFFCLATKERIFRMTMPMLSPGRLLTAGQSDENFIS